MPTYEYRCASGHQYEKREGFDAPAKQKCQACGKQATRVLHAPPVVFKGSGFYKTDNRGSSSESNTSDSVASTPAAAPAASDGHGHSHGPGGHTHDAPAAPAASSDTADTAAG